MERYFYSQEKNSNKFWNVKVDDNRLSVCFGKVGTSGRESLKEFSDNTTALKEAEKLITQKIKKGYIETVKEGKIPEKPDLSAMPMDEDLFWKIIDMFNWKKEGDDDAVMKPAIKFLASRSIEDIFAFHDIMSKKLYDLDGDDWAVPTDYPSGDEFLYIRCAVVINGRKHYEKVLRNPASIDGDLWFESLLHLPKDAWGLKTGKDSFDYTHITEYDYESYSNKTRWAHLNKE